jgi:glycosyltransferase involved in cell wall biosynthesis
LNVLHVIPSLSAVHGGPSLALPIMERVLSGLGVAVETATTNDDGPGRRTRHETGQPLAENNVTRWYFAKQTEFYKVSLPLWRWLRAHVARFDVVHLHAVFSFASLAAAWQARRHDVPYIIRPLGLLNQYGMTQRRSWLKQHSLRWLEGPLLRDATAVHFTSAAEQQEAELLGIPLRSIVIPLGIESVAEGNAERFLARHPELRGRKRVLYLSRLDPKKNLEGLLEAISVVSRHVESVSLLVCGGGDPGYATQLQALASRLGVERDVLWLGRVEGDTKADVLAAADVFGLPSFSENFGVSVIEALAAGVPCVVSPGVAVATEIQQAGAGTIVEPQGPAIAEGLLSLLQSDAARGAASQRARRLAAERFSAARMGERLVNLYGDVARKGRAADRPLSPAEMHWSGNATSQRAVHELSIPGRELP